MRPSTASRTPASATSPAPVSRCAVRPGRVALGLVGLAAVAAVGLGAASPAGGVSHRAPAVAGDMGPTGGGASPAAAGAAVG